MANTTLLPQVITTSNIDSRTALRIRKLELASAERMALLQVASDVMPIVELLGGVAIAEKMKRAGYFGSGFSAWLESQGLELALAGIIGLQVASRNPQGIQALSSGAGSVLGGLVKGLAV